MSRRKIRSHPVSTAKRRPATNLEIVWPSQVEGAMRTRVPSHIEPELASLRGHAPEGPEWLHEIKFDGYRILTRLERGRASLLTRQQNDWTARFPEIAAAMATLRVHTAWFDGEIVALRPDGVSNFQLLQNAFRQGTTGHLRYCVFDLLYLDGYDLRPAKLSDRKRILNELLDRQPQQHLQYVDHQTGRGQEFFRHSCEMGLEGIVCKRADRPYREGRGSDWIKVKCKQVESFIIGGYVDARSERRGLGNLLLGSYDSQGAFRFEGRVGTGFNMVTERDLLARMDRIRTEQCPFVAKPPQDGARRMHWVRPQLVASVEFTERTDDGLLRHPSFQGLRGDMPAESLVRESSADESKKATANRPPQKNGKRS